MYAHSTLLLFGKYMLRKVTTSFIFWILMHVSIIITKEVTHSISYKFLCKSYTLNFWLCLLASLMFIHFYALCNAIIVVFSLSSTNILLYITTYKHQYADHHIQWHMTHKYVILSSIWTYTISVWTSLYFMFKSMILNVTICRK